MFNRRLMIYLLAGLTLVITGILYEDSIFNEWPEMLYRNGAAILVALFGFGLIAYGFMSSEKVLKVKQE